MSTHRRRRPIRVAASIVAFLSLGVPDLVAAGSCWRPPTSAPVVDPFRPPACRWCAGNRGLDYATTAGQTIRAVATGRVTFAGAVAGTIYVVVRHADGRRVTYGNLSGESFDRGDLVTRGSVVGRTAGRFHLGVRDGDRYVDPAPFIGRWERPARLVPTDGTRPNPGPPARLRCRA